MVETSSFHVLSVSSCWYAVGDISSATRTVQHRPVEIYTNQGSVGPRRLYCLHCDCPRIRGWNNNHGRRKCCGSHFDEIVESDLVYCGPDNGIPCEKSSAREVRWSLHLKELDKCNFFDSQLDSGPCLKIAVANKVKDMLLAVKSQLSGTPRKNQAMMKARIYPEHNGNIWRVFFEHDVPQQSGSWTSWHIFRRR